MAQRSGSVRDTLARAVARSRNALAERSRPWVADAFLRSYYDLGDAVDAGVTWKGTSWMGVPIRKCPTDLWLYQEILAELRPDVVVECGTAFGGSALYFAHLCDVLGNGSVVTVDIDDWDVEVPGYTGRPSHPRITYLRGSSVDPAMVEQVRSHVADGATVMVVLDSDHRRDHVLAELRAYAPMVTPGSLLVVEDTMLNGHPVHRDFGPGPMEAVDAFLADDDRFAVEPLHEKFLVSFNPRGYLRRRDGNPAGAGAGRQTRSGLLGARPERYKAKKQRVL
jgi:cephalosporin hydroxylase